jgi:hypothetical protein
MIYVSGGDYKLKDFNHFDGGLNIWEWEKVGN